MLLHVLTSDEIVARPNFVETAESILQALGSRGVFHLRTRSLEGGAYVSLARHLSEQARRFNTRLIINDRIDVALAAHAHGVQLGSTSLLASDIRKFAPSLQIGTSVHSVEDLGTAITADWIIFGHVFETQSHPNLPPRGLETIRALLAETTIPVIAVGGIKPHHVRTLYQTGIAGIAVISGIWDAEEPQSAVTDYFSEVWERA